MTVSLEDGLIRTYEWIEEQVRYQHVGHDTVGLARTLVA